MNLQIHLAAPGPHRPLTMASTSSVTITPIFENSKRIDDIFGGLQQQQQDDQNCQTEPVDLSCNSSSSIAILKKGRIYEDAVDLSLPKQEDKVQDSSSSLDVLFDRIVTGEFEDKSDVSAGRFLENFYDKRQLLDSANLDRLLNQRRSVGWVVLEYPSLEQDDQVLRVRLIAEEDEWKVEDVRVPLR